MSGGIRRLGKRLDQDARARLAKGFIEETDEMKLFRYSEEGKVDLDLYRQLQTEANKMKIENQWVPEAHIRLLAEYLLARGAQVGTGICHGTRRGNEQAWFRRHLGGGARVIGTEISDSAAQFPDTIQWDFHEVDPAWIGATDLIYSNSWDHSYDPELAFGQWISCLSEGGHLLLDHSAGHEPGRANAMDPFGITEDGLVKMLDRIGAGIGGVAEVIDGARHKALPIRTVVFQRGKR